MTAPAAAATSLAEEPFWFPADGRELLGIATHPVVERSGRPAVVICSSGHWVTTVGPNRFNVDLARRLAARGHLAIRFDYGGVGESTGPTRRYRLEDPFARDAVAAAAWAASAGSPGTVLLGSCYGARTAMAAALLLDDVRGIALFPPAVRDFAHGERVASLPTSELVRRALRLSTIRGLRDRRTRQRYFRMIRRRLSPDRRRHRRTGGAFTWVSDMFIEPLEELARRRVPVLVVFGEADDFYADLLRGDDRARRLLASSDTIAVRVVPGRTHGLASVAVQQAVMAVVENWIDDLGPVARS